MSKQNKSSKTVVKSPSVASDILNSPLPVNRDEIALLALFADAYSYVSFKDQFEFHTVAECSGNIFTSKDYAKAYKALHDEIEIIKEIDFSDCLFKSSTTKHMVSNLKMQCPVSLQSRIASRMGYEMSKVAKELNGRSKEQKRLGFTRISDCKENIYWIKKDRGPKAVGAVFDRFHRACISLFGDIEGEKYFKELFWDYLNDARVPIAMEMLKNRLNEKLAKLFGEGRGQRLMTLFGLPGDPIQRGDLIGLPFGFVTIVKPPRVRKGWGDAPVKSDTTFSVRCICGELLPKKVSWHDLKRGRSFSCGCIGQKNYTKKWHDDALAMVSERFSQKRYAKKPDDRIEFKFSSEADFLKFIGLPWSKGLDVSRIDDHLDPVVPYAPGSVVWEDATANRRRAALARKLLKLHKEDEATREKALKLEDKGGLFYDLIKPEQKPVVRQRSSLNF